MTDSQRRTIQLFGQLRVSTNGQPVDLPGGVPARLVALLALHPGRRLSREQIGEQLWPEQPAERQRRALSDGLYRLRRAWGDGWLEADGESVALAPDVASDVATFQDLAAQPTPAAWQQAVDLYRLPAPEMGDEWLFVHRQRLAEVYVDLLGRLAQAAEQAFDHEAAHRYFHALQRADPLREEALRGAMRALAGLGRQAEALAAYDEFAALLRRELNIEPLADTRQLQAQIALERESMSADNAPALVPLVGRRRERSALLGRLRDGAAGRGGSMLLLGEAGIGKSRLLSFLAESARWRGWQVVEAGGEEFGRPGPYAPLDDALRRLLPRPRIQQLAQLMDHQDLAALARLLPEVAEVLPLPPLLDHAASQEGLLQAVARAVVALAEMRPQLLLLDDLHWAGPLFWPLLGALARGIVDAPVLLVGAARLDELQRQPAGWAFAQQLEEAGEPVFQLHGLGAADLAALAQTVAAVPLSPADLSALRRASGGNPLIAQALLQESGSAAPLPRHEEILDRRLARLSGPAQMAIQAAAILGGRTDYEVWSQMVSEVAAGDMPYVAGELEHARLLLVDAAGYRFAHDTLRHQVMTQMPEKRQRLLHGRALAALTGRSAVSAATLVYHAEGAGRGTALVDHAIRAGHEAAAMFAHESAVTYFQLAWDAMPPAHRARFAVGRELVLLHGVLAQREAQEVFLQTLAELAADDVRLRAEVAQLQSIFYNQTGRVVAAADAAGTAIDLARRSGDRQLLAAALAAHGQAVRTLGRTAEAAVLVEEAALMYQAVDDRRGVAATVDLLGGLAYEMGDYQTAAAQHGRAAAAFRALGHRVHEALALNNLGAAYWGLGDYAASRAAHEQALAINRTINHRRGEADNLDNMGGVDWVLGRYDEAIALYEAALAIRRAIADQWGVSISLGNLGSAYRLKGAHGTALSYLDEAYALNVKMGRGRGQCYNLHARGLTLLAQERVAEARAALEEALTGRSALGERDNLLQTKAALLRCAVAAAEPDAVAQLRRDLAAALAAQSFRASLRQEIHFACYEADRFLGQPAEEALLAAQRALEEIAAPLTVAERSHFLHAVPHNQALLGAVAAYATVQKVQLPARGRRGHVNVRWTVAALEDHAVPGRAARRRTVLARLLAEARTQGAEPGAAELADALGVSRRTVLRDLRRLSGSTAAN